MNKRNVIGHKIVAVRQERMWNGETRGFCVAVSSITLDNGTVIVLHPIETESEPCVGARAWTAKELAALSEKS